MKILLSNTLFGKYLDTLELSLSAYKQIRQNFDLFLSQTLELWMFVPCDEDGNVLKIIPFYEHKKGSDFEAMQHLKYNKAKERCLFEGFEVESVNENIIWITIKNFNSDNSNFSIQYAIKSRSFHYSFNEYKTIEDLIKYKPLLTVTAQKQIGL